MSYDVFTPRVGRTAVLQYHIIIPTVHPTVEIMTVYNGNQFGADTSSSSF